MVVILSVGIMAKKNHPWGWFCFSLLLKVLMFILGKPSPFVSSYREGFILIIIGKLNIK